LWVRRNRIPPVSHSVPTVDGSLSEVDIRKGVGPAGLLGDEVAVEEEFDVLDVRIPAFGPRLGTRVRKHRDRSEAESKLKSATSR
jgi:hypothetical protein